MGLCEKCIHWDGYCPYNMEGAMNEDWEDEVCAEDVAHCSNFDTAETV